MVPLAIKEYMIPSVEEERRIVLAVKELPRTSPLMGASVLDMAQSGYRG